MVQHGLPVDLDQVEAAIHHALGVLLTDRALTVGEGDRYLQPTPDALIEMHRRRFVRTVGHEIMTVALGLRIADERAGKKVLRRLPVIMGSMPKSIHDDLRTACNKLIHATHAEWRWEADEEHQRGFRSRLEQLVRPNRRVPAVILEGSEKSQQWYVFINLISFLDGAALALCEMRKTDRADS